MTYKRLYCSDWNFKTANTKEYTHCYHTYPAMMIPQVARKLIDEYAPKDKLQLIFDPYMGSGTTLVEATIKGIESKGTDINPLAHFISSVKTCHYNVNYIEQARENLINEIRDYKKEKVRNCDFTRISNYSFWYTEDSLYRLSYLTQCIDKINNEIRDFYRVCLSETVREVSFTRNGEFKRYKMSAKQLQNFHPDVFSIFLKKIERNIEGLISFNLVSNSNIAQTYGFNSSINIPDNILPEGSVDLVVTSPPYGDSHTTVAYGQFSRWANEWFNFPNAKNLDKFLMGGNVSKEKTFETESIFNELELIRERDEKRYYEVTSFLEDYWKSIQNVARVVRSGGRVCYVVGNRNVKSVQIELDFFTAEMFEKCGFKHDITIVREIPNKRMPAETSPTNKKGNKVSTMSNEFIVILTKK